MPGSIRSTADRLEWLAASGLVAFLALFAWLSLQNPVYTWDLVAYVGSVASLTLDGPDAIHARTFDLLEARLPEGAYAQLVSGSYGQAMAASAEDFQSQLAMYQIRPLYIGLLALSGAAGLGPVDAGFLLSLIPALGLLMVGYRWLCSHVPAGYALVFIIVLAFASRLFDVSRAVLPDALSAFVVFTGAWLVLERQRGLAGGCLLLAASVLIRTNNILFVAPLLLYLAVHRFRKQKSCHTPLIALGLSLAVYFALSRSFGQDWWRLFHHTFLGTIINQDEFSAAFSPGAYTDVLVQRGHALLVGSFAVYSMLMPFLLLASVGFLAARGQDNDGLSRLQAVVLLCLINIVLYFLLFPLVQTWDRFFVPFYFLIGIFAVRSAVYRTTSGTGPGRNRSGPVPADGGPSAPGSAEPG